MNVPPARGQWTSRVTSRDLARKGPSHPCLAADLQIRVLAKTRAQREWVGGLRRIGHFLRTLDSLAPGPSSRAITKADKTKVEKRKKWKKDGPNLIKDSKDRNFY